MITLHENGRIYHIWLRGSYSHIHSERQFLDMIDNAITRYENLTGHENYGKALRSKSILEVCRIFGIISKSKLIR